MRTLFVLLVVVGVFMLFCSAVEEVEESGGVIVRVV